MPLPSFFHLTVVTTAPVPERLEFYKIYKRKAVDPMKSVIKGTGYVLVHTPDMVLHNGTTQTTERIVNPESEYLKELPKHLRTFEQAVNYWPNQVYIGNKTPDELGAVAQPWFDKDCEGSDRYGRFGQIMPQEEFLLLVQACDVFGLVKLEQGFVDAHREQLAANKIMTEDIMARIPAEQTSAEEIARLVAEEHSEGLYHNGELVGCVNRAHDIDVNLSAHVMHENLVSKASSVMSLLSAVANAGIDKNEIEYVIDCAEEACGDMNQRGGGNFAKSAAEIAGLKNASGSDVRGFCAAPSHAMIEAASLVASGAYKCVAVTAGGCTAKLGMNGKDHVKKDMPILEDLIGGLCIIISQDDGVSPEVNLKALGRHTVGTSSGPQDVTTALVFKPLENNDMKVTDIDKYAGELHNSEILKPAGGGDPALQFFKVVGATAVMRGEMAKADLKSFIEKHGMTGWAPTQGHIPSGVPCIGFVRDDIMSGKIKNAMVVGKGSLFLGRLTNLFDGVSFVIQANTGAEEAGVSEEQVKGMIAKAMRDFASTLMAEAE